MSLCIVAECQSQGRPYAVLSHDWKITSGDASSENTDKLGFIKSGWPALHAGEISDMDLIGDVFFDHFRSVAVTEDSIEPELQAARGKFKSALIDRDLRGRFGLSYTDFQTRGKRMFRPDEHRQIIDQMQLTISQCELLVTGIIGDSAYTYQIEETFVSIIEHFGAIGEGGELASRWLHWRNQNSTLSLDQTLLNVYEAQRFGSMANSVGTDLSMYVLDHRGTVRQIRPAFKKFLEAQYKAIKHQKGVRVEPTSFFPDSIEPAPTVGPA
jgi:hypothetical protein